MADYWRNLKLSTKAFLEKTFHVPSLSISFSIALSLSLCHIAASRCKRRQGKYLFYTDIIKAQYAMPFCFVRATERDRGRGRGRERGRGRGRERYAANDILEARGDVGRGLTRDTQCTDNEINMFVLC